MFSLLLFSDVWRQIGGGQRAQRASGGVDSSSVYLCYEAFGGAAVARQCRGWATSRLSRDSLTYIVASTILVLGIAADPSKSFISPNLLFFFSPLLYWRRGVPSLLLSSSLVLLRPRVQWTQSRPPSTSTTVKLSIVLQVSSSVLLLFNTTRSVAELRVHFLAKRLIAENIKITGARNR